MHGQQNIKTCVAGLVAGHRIYYQYKELFIICNFHFNDQFVDLPCSAAFFLSNDATDNFKAYYIVAIRLKKPDGCSVGKRCSQLFLKLEGLPHIIRSVPLDTIVDQTNPAHT